MPDTIRTLSALQTLLADNTSGAISPQDARDFLVTALHSMTRQTASVSGATTVNALSGGLVELTLTGNVTSLTITNGIAGMRLTLALIQDATGSRTLTGATGGIIKWEAGDDPLLTTTASSRDVFEFCFDGTNWYEMSAVMDVR